MSTHRDRQFARLGRTKGTVLIVTIWVVLVLAGLALVFARSMRVAALLSANHVAAIECDYIAQGAAQLIMAQLAAAQAAAEEEITSTEPEITYEALPVGDGYFWLLGSNLDDDRDFVFGLTDETGKINLNTASEEMLLRLPGMTSELAASIIDWRDEDDEITTGGGEDEYYLLLPEPYNCKNGPLETVEEILLIKGATPELLYGEDTNLNGILDDNENDGDESDPPDNRNGQLEPGFYDYVTVYSAEDNVETDPNEVINVNDPEARGDIQTLLEESLSQERALEIMNAIPTSPDFTSVVDFYNQTGMTAEEFDPIAGRLSIGDDAVGTGLVNINTASKEVLMCLPDLTEQDVDALITYRESDTADLTSTAWVSEVLESVKATSIGTYITVNSYQWSADIICLSGNGRAYKRYRAVFDTQGSAPQIICWKSMSHLGWPLEPEIVATLRKGEQLTNAIVGYR